MANNVEDNLDLNSSHNDPLWETIWRSHYEKQKTSCMNNLVIEQTINEDQDESITHNTYVDLSSSSSSLDHIPSITALQNPS